MDGASPVVVPELQAKLDRKCDPGGNGRERRTISRLAESDVEPDNSSPADILIGGLRVAAHERLPHMIDDD
ncbi:hypothetical protein [Mesorhizobium sp. B2-3-15]|uniref:hypothetical protein n=1 Tax=Mesorhizobium sp. B2-3-15 TaxID=2589949 RepID=UPI001128E35B|nr:hypothetical protein [Mesorhizobium sp. B2-3-15]TPL71564.1 hypothetical protein FJ954_18465 [Mesorhizobium sp. B2-3-15]